MEEDKGNQGVAASPPGHQPSASAAVCAASSQSGVPNAGELLRLVGDLSHALYIMLACERCWGTGSAMTALGRDECPNCFGKKSTHPNALRYVEQVSKCCEQFASAMSAGTAETAIAGSAEGESPVAKPNAQNPPPANP